jgi:hypothetical protein
MRDLCTKPHRPFKDVFVERLKPSEPENVFLKLRAHHVYAFERYSIYYIAWTPLGQRSAA